MLKYTLWVNLKIWNAKANGKYCEICALNRQQCHCTCTYWPRVKCYSAIRCLACFGLLTAMWLRRQFFWEVTLRLWVFLTGRFGTKYECHSRYNISILLLLLTLEFDTSTVSHNNRNNIPVEAASSPSRADTSSEFLAGLNICITFRVQIVIARVRYKWLPDVIKPACITV
jgi:hypothetical protein